jgi:hypothetical protein
VRFSLPDTAYLDSRQAPVTAALRTGIQRSQPYYAGEASI